MSNQTLEGWGTNLAWWANAVGGWTNPVAQDNLMHALFDAGSGLGLTYLRYNIGGGNDPLCGTGGVHYPCIAPTYHATPGYEPSPGNYVWTQDAHQRWVAKRAQTLGANLLEAISYSPPYWMTNSGTSEGGVKGEDNLATAYFGSAPGTFADYLTTVVQHFATSFGITFHHLDPVNEPIQTWWTAGDTKQEGCAFNELHQEKSIQDIWNSLAAKGLVTRVSAMDENQEGSLTNAPKTTSHNFHLYDSTTRAEVAALDTHAYASNLGSVALATSALHYGKRLTVTEWGSNDQTGKDLSNQVLADVYLTRPTAWVIWQPDWPELISINYRNQVYTLNEGYYVYEQYTKFIRPGFQFIAVSDPQSLAAFSQRAHTLVIVTQNWTSSNRRVSYQLASFTRLGRSAAVYRTSSSERFAALGSVPISNSSFSYAAKAGSVTTFVIQNTSYVPPVATADNNTTGAGMNQFNYQGGWGYHTGQPGFHNHNHWSGRAGDYYTFRFIGQQARVYGPMASSGGIAAFSVDDGPETYFDTYAARRAEGLFLFATPTLAAATHTLKVRVTGLKNAASTGYNVSVDRIDVVSGGSAVGQDIYRIVNVKNGLALEVNSASLADGGMVETRQVAGADNQHWNLMAVGDGSYRIVNVNSGLDLEVNGAGKSNGATVDQWQDSGSSAAHEHWNVVAVGDSSYRIVNVNSGLDLEVNGTTGVVDQWQNVPGAKNQHWTLAVTH